MPPKEGAIIMERGNPGQSMNTQPSQPRYGPPGHGAHVYRGPRGLPPHPLAGYPPHMPAYNYPPRPQPQPQPQPSHQGDGNSNYLRRMAGGSDLVQDVRGQGELAMLRRQQPEPRHYDESGGYDYSERQPRPPQDEMRRAGYPQQPMPRSHVPHYPPPQTRTEGPPRSEGYHQSMNVARNDSHPGRGGMDARTASYESRAIPERTGEQNLPSRNRENLGDPDVSHPYQAEKPLPPASAEKAQPQFLADRKSGHSSSTQKKIPSTGVKRNDEDEDVSMMPVSPTDNMDDTSTPPPLPPISDNKKDDDNDSGEKTGGMYDHALLLAQVSAIAHGEFKKEEESESKDGKALPAQTSHPRPTFNSPSTPKKRSRNSPEFFESDTSVAVTPQASTPKQAASRNEEEMETSPGVHLTPTIPWQQRPYHDFPDTAPGRNRTWSGEVPRRHRRVISGSENIPPSALRLPPDGVYTPASEMSRARARAAWQAKHRPPKSNQNRDVIFHEGESGMEVEYQRTSPPSPTGSGSTVSFAVGSSASSGLSSFASAARSDPGRYIHGQRPRYTGSEPGHPFGRASPRSSGGALSLRARPQFSRKEGDTRIPDEQLRHQGPYLQERDPSYYRAVPPPGYNFHRGERYEQHNSEPPASQRSQSEAPHTHGSQPYAHDNPSQRGAPARGPISDTSGMGGVPPTMRYEGGTPNVTPSPAKHSDVPLDRRYFAGARRNARFPMEGAYNRGEQYYQDQARKRNVQFMQEAHQEQERMSSGDYPPAPGSYSDHESHLGDPSSPAGSQGGYPPYPLSSEWGPQTTAHYDHYNYPPHSTEKLFRREDVGADNRQYWSPRLPTKYGPYSASDRQALLDKNSSAQFPQKTILKKKFAWKQFPELEAFLIAHREEYLEHSALNYTVEQKRYNNRLTEELLDLAARHNYIFDEEVFSFVSVRDRIRCYFKSYVQSSKKKGILIGYGSKKKLGLLPPRGDKDDGKNDAGSHDVKIHNEDETQREEGDNESS